MEVIPMVRGELTCDRLFEVLDGLAEVLFSDAGKIQRYDGDGCLEDEILEFRKAAAQMQSAARKLKRACALRNERKLFGVPNGGPGSLVKFREKS
jgi:hypothetical protein